MQRLPEFSYEVACAISPGRRDYQEDAVIADFPLGSDLGFAVLADGMGGHAAGDIASKIIVTEVFSELKLQSGDRKHFEANVTDILLDATRAANQCINGHVQNNPATGGMGATLVAPVLFGNQLSWISVGDSPLFLFRDGQLSQINEDHSMAPQIDFMVETGLIGAESARNHPDRNCLTSVLNGEEIARIDCPESPVELLPGDVVVASSDGLQSLAHEEIEAALGENADKNSTAIANALLHDIEELDDPDQDNVSFAVIKIQRRPGFVSRHGKQATKKPATMPTVRQRAPAIPEIAHASSVATIGSAAIRLLQSFRRAANTRDSTT